MPVFTTPSPRALKFCACVWAALLTLSAAPLSMASDNPAAATSLEWLAFRFRSDFSIDLNADQGWAAQENAQAALHYDKPFRFRIQTMATQSPAQGHLLSLQYRAQGGDWQPVGVSDFPYPAFATPMVSVVSTDAYAQGAETQRLLGSAATPWDDGAGLNASAATPVWRTTGEALEWEWPLVIRRFSDGPAFAQNDEVFELRVVDGLGAPLAGPADALVSMSAEPGHLGGTFIETPVRIGPYQSDNGHLYFFMEPSETHNRFMAVTSADFGNTWKEVDGEGRPDAVDLEGVATTRIGSVIHILHQISEEVLYHAFETGDSETNPGRWLVNSQSIARLAEPPTQFVDVAARSDGSLVALYAGAQKLFLQTRSAQGDWSAPREVDVDTGPELSGPMLVSGPEDILTLAYTGRDGSGFIRHLHPDDSLSPRLVLSRALGVSDSENGAILPMIVLPDSGSTVVLYREESGLLHERRFSLTGELSEPVQVTALSVVTNAVDSEQAGADLVQHDGSLHVLFIAQQSRAIFHSRSTQPGVWSTPQAIIEGVDAGWVRGSVHLNASGDPVYGFVFDGGSRGGSGFNRYFALPL